MKLLLTSNGLSNPTITNTLFELVRKKPEDISLVFIPTAAGVEVDSADWLDNDICNIRNQHFKHVEIVDISAVPEGVWRPKVEASDVLFFGGGNVYHLMEWINKSGLVNILPELLKTKVWVGLSAGSMVLGKDLSLKISQEIYEEDLEKTEEMAGLNYVDFYFLPHLNSMYFPQARQENVKRIIQGMSEKIYVLDDNSALKVVNGKAHIVSEGEWLEFN